MYKSLGRPEWHRNKPSALDPRALRTSIPFILPAVISTSQPTRCGRGVIVPVTGKANVPVVATHNLGRMVQGMWALLNAGGQAFTPKLKFGSGGSAVSSNVAQTIVADEDMTQCLIVFF